MGVTLEEKPIQALFSDKSVGNIWQRKLQSYFYHHSSNLLFDWHTLLCIGENARHHSPSVVSPVRLDEIHISVFGQKGHQLIIGPEKRLIER